VENNAAAFASTLEKAQAATDHVDQERVAFRAGPSVACDTTTANPGVAMMRPYEQAAEEARKLISRMPPSATEADAEAKRGIINDAFARASDASQAIEAKLKAQGVPEKDLALARMSTNMLAAQLLEETLQIS
jgi:hypothetical protein